MIHLVYFHFGTELAHPSFSIMDFFHQSISVYPIILLLKLITNQVRMSQEKTELKMNGITGRTETGTSAGSSMTCSSVLKGSGENMAKQGLTQQVILKDQIDLSQVPEVRNIQKTILWLRDQLLTEEGAKLIPGDKADEIRSRLNLIEAELEGLTRKMANFLNAEKTLEDSSSIKSGSLSELEKKVHNYEDKLIQATKREEELEEKIAKLTSMIFSTNPPVFPKESIIPKPRECMEYIRKCTLEEQNLIKKQYSRIKLQLEKRSQRILLYYTYRNDKPNECNCSKEFREWVDKMIEEFEPGADCYSVAQAFILNPKDNQIAQDYHMDYNEHMRTFFVSMDYLTTLNSTQYFRERLQQPSALSLRGGIQYGNDEKEILNRENREFMEVSQMVCKPYNILLMKPGTAHRGIANRSGVDRVLFSVTYTDLKGFLSGQPKIATQKQDVQ